MGAGEEKKGQADGVPDSPPQPLSDPLPGAEGLHGEGQWGRDSMLPSLTYHTEASRAPCPSPVPAMITSHPNTTIAIKGHAKELNCTARGERPIIIRWEKGDTVIDPDRVMRYTISTKDSGDEVVSTLKVSAQARPRDPDSLDVRIPQL